MRCPHCDQDLGSLQTWLSRERRAKLKAAGKCIDCGEPLDQRFQGVGCLPLIRCAACRSEKKRREATLRAEGYG